MITFNDILAESLQYQYLESNQLGQVVKELRQYNNWPQVGLGSGAGVGSKTIQRIERGDGCEQKTRRLLARAFGFEDVETFNKPYPLFNNYLFQKKLQEIDQSHTYYVLDDIASGWDLVNKLNPADSCHKAYLNVNQQDHDGIIELETLLQDYMLAKEDVGPKLQEDCAEEFDEVINQLRGGNIVLKSVIRHLRVYLGNGQSQSSNSIVLPTLHLFICDYDTAPKECWLPKNQ